MVGAAAAAGEAAAAEAASSACGACGAGAVAGGECGRCLGAGRGEWRVVSEGLTTRRAADDVGIKK